MHKSKSQKNLCEKGVVAFKIWIKTKKNFIYLTKSNKDYIHIQMKEHAKSLVEIKKDKSGNAQKPVILLEISFQQKNWIDKSLAL